MSRVRVLLVQLGSHGDCLFSTIVARQIKEFDYPGAYLAWLIGDKYKNAIINNPDIDEIIELPLNGNLQEKRDNIEEIIKNMGLDYDQVFITDFYKPNYNKFYGTTRSAILRCYPHKIKTKIEARIFLTENEKDNVKRFCSKNKINSDSFNILIEAMPQSAQSSMNIQKALLLAEHMVKINPRVKCIISSPQKLPESDLYVDASVLSYRENAELANYCDLLLGCSSGISWLCLSNWTKPLNMVQIINPNYANGNFSASVKHDLMYHGITTANIIELYNPAEKVIIECLRIILCKSFIDAQKKYDKDNFYTFTNKMFLAEAKLRYVYKIKMWKIYAWQYIGVLRDYVRLRTRIKKLFSFCGLSLDGKK